VPSWQEGLEHGWSVEQNDLGLPIHSYGDEWLFDVIDISMIPENIIDTAIAKGLRIISITNHNEIGNVKRGNKTCLRKKTF